MKRVIISETGESGLPSEFLLDLSETAVKDCIGCWSCWVKTPGRCVHKDLDEFYRAYISADKAVFFTKLSKGFVSGNLKSLFDRMIPLYLPFISYETGESMHLPRYEKYPDIEVYYEGTFENADGQAIFEDYMKRTFYQFHSELKIIKPVGEYKEELVV